jgi:hypothetical protein
MATSSLPAVTVPCAACGHPVALALARWLIAGAHCRDCFEDRMAEVHALVRAARRVAHAA